MSEPLFFVVHVRVTMIMFVGMIVVVIIVAMGMTSVSVTTQYKEADKVGEESGRSNNKDEFWVVDFGRFDESGQGLEDDRNA